MQLTTEHSIQTRSQRVYLKSIKGELSSAIPSLIGPGSTVWVQRVMSPLHVTNRGYIKDSSTSMYFSIVVCALAGYVRSCLLCLIKNVIRRCDACRKAWHDNVK